LEARPGCLYIEFSGQVTYSERFSKLSGREPEGGKTSKLGLHGRPSCLGVSARLGMVVVMVLCPHRGMPWHDATMLAVTTLLAWWWFANCPMRHELAVTFIIASSWRQ
jgi:hypothetical protein